MAVTGTDVGTLFHGSGGDGDTSNVLLLAPALSDSEDEACIDLLTIADISQENLLSVTFTQTAQDRLELWHTHAGDDLPAQAGIITVGEQTRSTSASRSSPSQTPGPITIDAVSDPADLTGLGISLTNYLSEWAENNNQTVVCFHSLTPLLQYADLQRVFRFLHVLTGRIASSDAVAHYHMDPTAHDEQTRQTLVQLFDATIELDADGTRSITHR
jgi:hypothetical protein